jgi:hypothetical protein
VSAGEQLDPVAEGIVDVALLHATDLVAAAHRMAGGIERRRQAIEVVDDQRRVGLAGGAEVDLDAEMDLDQLVLESAAAP